MLNVRYTSSFKKDYKRIKKQGIQIDSELAIVIEKLKNEEQLEQKYNDHALNDTRFYKKMRDCHIRPDLVLIYKIKNNELILELIRLGSHSELKL